MKKVILFVMVLVLLGGFSESFARKGFSRNEVLRLAEKKCEDIMQSLDLCVVLGRQYGCGRAEEMMYQAAMNVFESRRMAEELSEMCYWVCRNSEDYYDFRRDFKEECIKGFVEGFLGK